MRPDPTGEHTARLIVEGAGVGLVLLDSELRVRAWNAWIARASGIETGAALGRPLAEVVPTFFEGHEPELEEVAGTGGYRFLSALLHPELLPLREPDGSYLVHDVLLSPVEASGERRWVLLTVRSVAEHVRAYRDLERLFTQVAEGKRVWEATFDAVGELIWVVDPAGLVLRANRAVARRAGRPFSEIVGRPCGEVFGVPDCDACLAATPDGGEGIARCLGPDHRFAVYPVGDGNRVCVAVDLSPIRRAWAQAARAEKTFSLVRLVAGAAHELNNPLSAIAGAAEVALLTCEDPGLRRKLEIINEQAHRAAGILRRLQEFARLRPGGREPVDLGGVCARVLSGVSVPEGVRVVRDCPPGGLPRVMGQADRLESLLAALLDNALRAVGKCGEVWIRGRHDSESDHVEVRVEDTGPGFPPEALPRVFDPFFTTREVGQGAGLGLSECQGIVADHGGTIEAANRPEGGARITVRLPVRGSRPGDLIPPVGTQDRMPAGLPTSH
ncbi:PAS domain-containing sensor histidine kinase [Deferrisoma camini]|uniref:PAS domain-containing sensor histidine kinase n=1 Tax=Deferrisoma camini TaxID=1035120 RepID=UPI00046CA0EA|nr:PAS domain-containing sensor histidine kinase [Deferrisoma camini]